MNDISKQVKFNIIRYANCWEDADVLLQSLQLSSGATICCVASAGDNALALLSTAPACVDAFDISPVQVYLTELKQAAFMALEYREMLKFLGVIPSNGDYKLWLLKHMLPVLSQPAIKYWKTNPQIIINGLVQAGKFERYFHSFRKYFLPLVHSKKTVRQLLEAKTDDEQKQFYDIKWNNHRWQWLMAFFFSRRVMGKYGRDPQFLKQVQIPVSQFIRQKAAQHLQSHYSTQNAFLEMIFTGNYGNNLPFYLRKENFQIIKKNIHKLNVIQADATAIIQRRYYDVCCLSNIFEYMPQHQFERLVQDWQPYLSPKTKLAFWNLMAPRSFAETAPAAYEKIAVDESLLHSDKGFFYSRFCLEERI